MNYIDINKDLIPYTFDITLESETYTFRINYNSIADFFTVDLSKNGEVIIVGEKLVYAKPLFLTTELKDTPKIDILPFDLSGKADRITFENLNESVFLYLVGE